jgi:short-subunit dehydrogenase
MMTEKEKTNEHNVVWSPVTVTVLVPMEIETDVSELVKKSDLSGIPVTDVSGNDEQSQKVIGEVLDKLQKSESVSEAINLLLIAATQYKSKNPVCKILFTPYLGLVPDQEV